MAISEQRPGFSHFFFLINSVSVKKNKKKKHTDFKAWFGLLHVAESLRETPSVSSSKLLCSATTLSSANWTESQLSHPAPSLQTHCRPFSSVRMDGNDASCMNTQDNEHIYIQLLRTLKEQCSNWAFSGRLQHKSVCKESTKICSSS